jgi:hypothetical protein
MYLPFRAGVKNKSLKQSKGTGASGSFKIREVVKSKKKPAAKPKKAVKPKAAKPKKAKTPKKTAAKKPYFFFGVFLGLTALVFFGDLVAFFAGLAASFFAAAGFLAFGFAAFFSAAGFFEEQELETVEGNWCFRDIQDRRSSQTQTEACSQTKESCKTKGSNCEITI